MIRVNSRSRVFCNSIKAEPRKSSQLISKFCTYFSSQLLNLLPLVTSRLSWNFQEHGTNLRKFSSVSKQENFNCAGSLIRWARARVGESRHRDRMRGSGQKEERESLGNSESRLFGALMYRFKRQNLPKNIHSAQLNRTSKESKEILQQLEKERKKKERHEQNNNSEVWLRTPVKSSLFSIFFLSQHGSLYFGGSLFLCPIASSSEAF